MTKKFSEPPQRLVCIRRVETDDGHTAVREELFLRADELQTQWIYATPRAQAVGGVDSILVYVPKDFGRL